MLYCIVIVANADMRGISFCPHGWHSLSR